MYEPFRGVALNNVIIGLFYADLFLVKASRVDKSNLNVRTLLMQLTVLKRPRTVIQDSPLFAWLSVGISKFHMITFARQFSKCLPFPLPNTYRVLK